MTDEQATECVRQLNRNLAGIGFFVFCLLVCVVILIFK